MEGATGLLPAYNTAMGLICYFERQVCTAPCNWFSDFGTTRIKELRYTNLKPQFEFTQIQSTPVAIPRPNSQELRRDCARNVRPWLVQCQWPMAAKNWAASNQRRSRRM